jgi:hypothetical protein
MKGFLVMFSVISYEMNACKSRIRFELQPLHIAQSTKYVAAPFTPFTFALTECKITICVQSHALTWT